MKGIGAKSMGAGVATIASAGAAVGIGNVFSSYSWGLGAKPNLADIENQYQAAESAIGLAIFVITFRVRGTIAVEFINSIQG